MFRYNDAIENKRAGLVGKEVRFEIQHIAVGGLPAEAYYGGNASAAKVEIDTIAGTRADNRAAEPAMRKKAGQSKMAAPEGIRLESCGNAWI